MMLLITHSDTRRKSILKSVRVNIVPSFVHKITLLLFANVLSLVVAYNCTEINYTNSVQHQVPKSIWFR